MHTQTTTDTHFCGAGHVTHDNQSQQMGKMISEEGRMWRMGLLYGGYYGNSSESHSQKFVPSTKLLISGFLFPILKTFVGIFFDRAVDLVGAFFVSDINLQMTL